MKTLSLLLSICLAVCACSQQPKTESGSPYEDFCTRSINIPTDQMVDVLSKGADWTKEAEYTAVHLMDSAKCTTCLANKLMYWEAYEKDLKKHNPKCCFCIIISGDQHTEEFVQKVLYYTKYRPIMYIDTAGCFYKAKLLTDSVNVPDNFLMDRNGRVQIIGEPIGNEGLARTIYEHISKKQGQTP